MTPQYALFLQSLEQAEKNVLLMFTGVALAIAAWYSIPALPVAWQSRARFVAKAYALGMLIAVIILGWRLS